VNRLRLHWFDAGIGLAVVCAGLAFLRRGNSVSFLLWANCIAQFQHQAEEYRFPGYFPGMMNSVMFNSRQPDRYPLNSNTALVINVSVGWLAYLLAAVLGEKVLWFGIAVMLVSIGNVIAHTFLFNLKGGTRYNPGMLTAIVLFAPIATSFAYLLLASNLATPAYWIAGLVLGVVLNYVGILKLIDWLKDEDTAYIFPKRFLLPDQRV
jgi:hypothetical protein